MLRSLVRRASIVAAVATLATIASVPAASASSVAGAVYAITNSTAGNAVIAWDRHPDGSLDNARTYPTGGLGTGAGLGSQGAVTVDADHELLLVVNAGSNDISSFRITHRGLVLADRIASGGAMPVSVAVFDNLVYVLNAGTPNNVTGFRVDGDGDLRALAGSTRPLSADSTGPAQVGFAADGRTLVVTEKATSLIDTYTVRSRGRLDGPAVHASAGPTPFGFAVTRRNTLLVSEAGTGGGASSYVISHDAGFRTASSNVMTGQRAACWTVVTPSGRFGYVTNAGTGNISGFRLRADGTAALLDASGVTATTGGNPTDAAISRDGSYLYARVAATAQVAIFRIASDGSLSAIDPLVGTPAGLAGLAGF